MCDIDRLHRIFWQLHHDDPIVVRSPAYPTALIIGNSFIALAKKSANRFLVFRYYWGESKTERMPQTTERTSLTSGDPRAFDRLYTECAPRVLGYLLRLTGGKRAEAEDLVQETFLAAYAHRERFGGRSQPLAWLLGIAHRRWRDDRRTPRPETTPLSPDDTEGAAPGHADRVTRAATLEWALARLKDEERQALLLTAVQGLSYREAAEVLGEPVGTVKWRVHEATRSLRRLLCEWEENREPAKASATAAR